MSNKQNKPGAKPVNTNAQRGLSADVARCAGVGEDGDWREGCDTCLRRLSPVIGDIGVHMSPPLIITFWCEYHIDA